MRLPAPLAPNRPGAKPATVREPSCDFLAARGAAIRSPAGVSDAEQGTPMLTPDPPVYSLNWRRLRAAGRNASRPGPPAPMVMVSCDQQDLSLSFNLLVLALL